MVFSWVLGSVMMGWSHAKALAPWPNGPYIKIQGLTPYSTPLLEVARHLLGSQDSP